MTNAVYRDEDWSPPGAIAPPAKQPVSLDRDATKFDAATGRPTITIVKPKPEPGVYSDEDWKPPAERQEAVPSRDVSRAEAAARGAIDISTYGLAPALYGAGAAGAAGKTPEQQQAEIVPGTDYPGGEMVGEGLSRLWHNHFGSHPDPAAREAYNQGAQSMIGNDQLAWDQHAGYYLAGQFGAALSSPGSFAGHFLRKGIEGLAKKIIGGGLATGAGNALYQSGKALSEGKPEEIPKAATEGAVTGGVLGIGGRVASEALGGVASKVASRVGSLVRGAINPDWEVGHQVVGALRGDIHAPTPDVGVGPSMAAPTAEAPVITADVGGKQTLGLAQRVAKASPEGGQAIRDVVNPRYEEQPARIGHFIRSLAGGKNYTEEADRIAAEKAAINPAKYAKAYEAGDRPIWSFGSPDMPDNSLEAFAATDAGKRAIGNAVRQGSDWAYRDGLTNFKPSVTITPSGQLVFNKGPTGVETYPNIQFWDYVQRSLREEIDNAKGAARTRLSGVRDKLLTQLDEQVPEFADARRTAASFFGAEDALEAGKNFVTSKEKDLTESARNFAAFKPEERQIFQRSFASNLATQIEAIAPGTDLTARSKVLDSVFLRQGLPRRKIEMILGPQKTSELEAQLRFEEGIDRVRRVVQEPNWLKEMAKSAGGHIGGGAGVAGAVGGIEYLKEGEVDPKLILGSAFGFGLYRKGAGKIDAKVALKIGQMLASDDPAMYQKAAQMAAASEPIMNALRTFTAAGIRVGSADVGFTHLKAAGLLAMQKVWGLRKGHEDEHHHRESPDQGPQQDAGQ